MELDFLTQVNSLLNTNGAIIGIVIVFVLVFILLARVAVAFEGNEKARKLKEVFNMVDDVLYDAIVAVMYTAEEQDFAHAEADRYSQIIGKSIDWRMVLVLQSGERFLETQIQQDVDLVLLYNKAERIYQEVKNGFADEDEDGVLDGLQ